MIYIYVGKEKEKEIKLNVDVVLTDLQPEQRNSRSVFPSNVLGRDGMGGRSSFSLRAGDCAI